MKLSRSMVCAERCPVVESHKQRFQRRRSRAHQRGLPIMSTIRHGFTLSTVGHVAGYPVSHSYRTPAGGQRAFDSGRRTGATRHARPFPQERCQGRDRPGALESLACYPRSAGLLCLVYSSAIAKSRSAAAIILFRRHSPYPPFLLDYTIVEIEINKEGLVCTAR